MAYFRRGVPVLHHRGPAFPAAPSSFPAYYSQGYPYYGNINPHRIPPRGGGDYYSGFNDIITSVLWRSPPNPSVRAGANSLVLYGESNVAIAMPRHDGPSMEAMIAKNLKTKNCSDVEAVDEDGVTKICAVCLDDLCGGVYEGEIGVLDCRHEYHACCIKNWLVRKNVCPLCGTTAVKVY